MADYKFDGTYFINKKYDKLAKVNGDYIEELL